MTKMTHISEKAAKVRALFPDSAKIDLWYPLMNGFEGMLLANGSTNLRRKVRLLPEDESFCWRIDRITAKGAEKFIGYQPMT